MSTRLMRWALATGVIAVLALAGAAVCGGVGLASLVPASDQISGWAALQADRPATSASELYKIYDGGDLPWRQAGVTSAFQRVYKNATSKHILTLAMHRTGTSSQAAKALYTKKNAAYASQPGYVAVGTRAALAKPSNGVIAHLWGKTYYCTITINGTSAADVTAAKSFLNALSTKITKSG
jgi:hypothetical protein